MKRVLTTLVLLSAPLAAQSASFTTFGNPCAWSSPPLVAISLPRLGSTFVVETLSGGSTGGYEGGTTRVLLIGVSRTSWGNLTLPIGPGVFHAAGLGACGDLSISVEQLVVLPYAFGRPPVTTALPIPNQPSLIGASFFLQSMELRANLRLMLSLTFGTAGEARIGT